MSHTIVALMLRTSIPFNTWLEQPDGVIETAIELLLEQDETSRQDRLDSSSSSGPQMSG